MEMLFSKWNILFWPFYILGWKPWAKDGDDGFGYIDIPDGYYRLTVAPRTGHTAKEVCKQMAKVFNDKMDTPPGFDNTREWLNLKVCEFFEIKDSAQTWGGFHDLHRFTVDTFSFQVTPEEREEALKQLKGCNALKIVFDEVKRMQDGAVEDAKWRYRDNYEEAAFDKLEEDPDFFNEQSEVIHD